MTKLISEPILLKLSLDNLAYAINAANENCSLDQWRLHFFGKVLFAMQIYETNIINRHKIDGTPINFEECMDYFYKILEIEIPIHRKEIEIMIEAYK